MQKSFVALITAPAVNLKKARFLGISLNRKINDKPTVLTALAFYTNSSAQVADALLNRSHSDTVTCLRGHSCRG